MPPSPTLRTFRSQIGQGDELAGNPESLRLGKQVRGADWRVGGAPLRWGPPLLKPPAASDLGRDGGSGPAPRVTRAHDAGGGDLPRLVLRIARPLFSQDGFDSIQLEGSSGANGLADSMMQDLLKLTLEDRGAAVVGVAEAGDDPRALLRDRHQR